jgi:hypothetical protein
MLCIEEKPNQPFYRMYNFAQSILDSFEIFANINSNAELRIRSQFLHLMTKVSHHNFCFNFCTDHLRQDGMDYFGNPAFHSTLLYICAGVGPVGDKDGKIGVDHDLKRLRLTTLAYTGTHVRIY